MTTFTKQTRAGIVREVALLHCDNVGATVEWERPSEMWLGKREWSVSFHYADASGREYWGTVFVTGTVEMYTRNTRTGHGMLVSARSKLQQRQGLSDTGRYLIQLARRESTSVAVQNDEDVKTIDCTPSWRAQLSICKMLILNGDAEGQRTAWSELERMADLADRFTSAAPYLPLVIELAEGNVIDDPDEAERQPAAIEAVRKSITA